MRALALALVLGVTGVAGTGCQVTYEPVYDPPAAGSAEIGPDGQPVARTPSRYRRVVRVDWDGIGDACVSALEVTGYAVYVAARITVEAAIHCGACVCHH